MSRPHRGRAVIVGISRYANVPALPPAVRVDAEDVAALLVDPERGGFDPANVEVLLDSAATTSAVQRALCASAELSPDEPHLFFFSGHGHRSPHRLGERSWLLTAESELGDLATTAFSATDLQDLLNAIPSRRQVVILDACHAAAVGIGKGMTASLPAGIGGGALDQLVRGSGKALLQSCRAEEVSVVLPGHWNSLFTATLLEALRGAAQDRGDGYVRVLDVFHHVAEEVPKHAAQHPVLKADNLGTNFAVVRRKPEVTPASFIAAPKIEKLLARLYPHGPTQDGIWSRAGGDVSRLNLFGVGFAQWHAALRRIEGGGDLTLPALLEAVADDHPANPDIKALLDAARARA